MSNTVILAVDPSDLQTVDALTLAGPLTALVAVCLVLAVVLVITVIVMSRPRRNSAKATQPRGAHNEAGPKATWHARINDAQSRYESGTLNREDAFVELALIARDFAGASSGKRLEASTLAALMRLPRTPANRQGLDTLRHTIEALYPPEFADPSLNTLAKSVTVKEAAGWVSNLVERWRS